MLQLYRSSFESMHAICLVRCQRFFAYYIVFLTAIKICVSPCYAHPFFVIVQIIANLTCASFCSAGSPTTLHRTVQFTLHIAICVFIVLGLRDWSCACMFVSLERIFCSSELGSNKTFRTCLAKLARFAVHNMVICFGISKIAKL